jgi:hypothetical protein
MGFTSDDIRFVLAAFNYVMVLTSEHECILSELNIEIAFKILIRSAEIALGNAPPYRD